MGHVIIKEMVCFNRWRIANGSVICHIPKSDGTPLVPYREPQFPNHVEDIEPFPYLAPISHEIIIKSLKFVNQRHPSGPLQSIKLLLLKWLAKPRSQT